ncbi:MAG TPA: BamA/TamA family outer membrane protein [Kofleriaceae bacterium]|jgi:hypothetical protein|nr:BamA/TamA family outer membrane protein [Kofleriaceae bacterium]
MKPFPMFWRLAAASIALLVARGSARADCHLETKFFPLPVWATTPNEGNTWGLMPVVVRICPSDHRTHWILAPDITWNSVIHYTATMRWYYYPDDDTTISLFTSASTRINYSALLTWEHLPLASGRWTHEGIAGIDRNAFDRFFGIGPDTPASAESSYTGVRLLASERLGYNVGGGINLGLTLAAERDRVDDVGVFGLPLSPEAFPSAPGMQGAELLTQGLDLRYDDRIGGDFARAGSYVDASVQYAEAISGSPNFWRLNTQFKRIWPELGWLSGAAHLDWNAVSSRDVPFYQQSSLGGAFLLRGFEEGRFVDTQAWTAEVEQRVRVLQTHWFNVTTDWRIDPFVAAGQVFDSADTVISNVKVSAGFGLRAFVHPRLLARIDLADGGEGIKVYVEIGYPY